MVLFGTATLMSLQAPLARESMHSAPMWLASVEIKSMQAAVRQEECVPPIASCLTGSRAEVIRALHIIRALFS